MLWIISYAGEQIISTINDHKNNKIGHEVDEKYAIIVKSNTKPDFNSKKQQLQVTFRKKKIKLFLGNIPYEKKINDFKQ